MDQVQVEPVQAEPLQGSLEHRPGVVLPGVLDPQLGRDEQVLTGKAAGGDRPPDGFLVLVGGGGVQVPVAGLQGLFDDLLGLLGRDLEDAETEDGHLYAVVQGDLRYLRAHNPHVFISDKTAHGTNPMSQQFVTLRMNHIGCTVDRIRKDRILREALAAKADPLHLSLVFGISHSTAVRYSAVAEHLLSDELDRASQSS